MTQYLTAIVQQIEAEGLPQWRSEDTHFFECQLHSDMTGASPKEITPSAVAGYDVALVYPSGERQKLPLSGWVIRW